MQQPTVGRIVHVLVDPKDNNGSDVAPAIITRVWGAPDGYPGGAVNIRVLRDGYPGDSEWMTSIPLYDDEESARATGLARAAFWPPRA
jgi:hypothetical protein